jgi:hypothetical protein
MSQLHNFFDCLVDIDLVATPEGKAGDRGPGRAGHLLHRGDVIQIDDPSYIVGNISEFNEFHVNQRLAQADCFQSARASSALVQAAPQQFAQHSGNAVGLSATPITVCLVA